MAVELDGAGAIAALASRDDELGDRTIERPLDDEGHGASLDRLGGERVAVVAIAADAEEERSRDDGSRVVRELAYLDGRRVGRRSSGASAAMTRSRSTPGESTSGTQWSRKASDLPQKCAICGSFLTHALARATAQPVTLTAGRRMVAPGAFGPS